MELKELEGRPVPRIRWHNTEDYELVGATEPKVTTPGRRVSGTSSPASSPQSPRRWRTNPPGNNTAQRPAGPRTPSSAQVSSGSASARTTPVSAQANQSFSSSKGPRTPVSATRTTAPRLPPAGSSSSSPVRPLSVQAGYPSTKTGPQSAKAGFAPSSSRTPTSAQASSNPASARTPATPVSAQAKPPFSSPTGGASHACVCVCCAPGRLSSTSYRVFLIMHREEGDLP
jgi:hypothetical protein